MKYSFCIPLSLFFFVLLQLSAFRADSQSEGARIFDLGVEFQAYPTGLIPGIRGTLGINSKNAIHLRAGYNLANHRNLGVQESEIGGGAGFTLGYEHYFGPELTKWFLGLRSDLWFNSIDWQNNEGMPNETNGTTKLVVVQPTLAGGYLFKLGRGNWIFTPEVAFGFEINVVEDGEDVGEGPVFLLGFVFAHRFGGPNQER